MGYASDTNISVYFGGRRIWQGATYSSSSSAGALFPDRIGTNRYSAAANSTMSFYPYGDEITSSAPDQLKFATYTRDSYTSFDYADQRYYASTYGRFLTSDPKSGSSRSGSPASWNKYSYTRGDPVNRADPAGTDDCDPSGTVCLPDCDPTTQFDCLAGYTYCPAEYAYCYTGNGSTPLMYTSLPSVCSGWSPDQISPTLAMACFAAAAQEAPPATVTSWPPSCTLEVGYLPNVFGSRFSHAFIGIGGASGVSEYIEVSPALSSVGPTMHVNFTPNGIYNDSTIGINFWSIDSPQACYYDAAIAQDAASLPPAYYLGLTSNSNSFVSSMLNEAGVGLPPSRAGGPPNAIGWGNPIVYAPPNPILLP